MDASSGPGTPAYTRPGRLVACVAPPGALEGLALPRDAVEFVARARELGYHFSYARRSDFRDGVMFDLVATSADGLVAVVAVLGRHERGVVPAILRFLGLEVHLVGGALLPQMPTASARDVLTAWADGFGHVAPDPALIEDVDAASRPICSFSAEEIARGLSAVDDVEGRSVDDVVSELACRRRHPSNLTRLLWAS